MSEPVPRIEPAELVERYDVVLLDSYGVLVDEHGALPGAAALLQRLHDAGRRFMVVSNDASRLPATSVARYQARGLPIDADHLLTSGDLIAPYLHAHGLTGLRTIVLGPADSRTLVTDAGGLVIEPDDPAPELVIVCDDAGYAFRETIETLIDTLFARYAAGHRVPLLLPNPDRIYPRAPGSFGLTAGSVAALVEDALALRFPASPPRFVGLGKPHRPIFEHALARLHATPDDRVVMVGDQLATDIAGAVAMGLHSVLIATGVSDPQQLPAAGPRPTFWMAGPG